MVVAFADSPMVLLITIPCWFIRKILDSFTVSGFTASLNTTLGATETDTEVLFAVGVTLETVGAEVSSDALTVKVLVPTADRAFPTFASQLVLGLVVEKSLMAVVAVNVLDPELMAPGQFKTTNRRLGSIETKGVAHPL